MAGFTACDDAPETAKPQENPQGPVLEGSIASGATATATSTMTAGVDLSSLDAETTPSLTLYSLSAGTSELQDSQLSGYLQISSSELFAEYVELAPVDGVQGTVSTADLNEAYVQFFGRAPQTSTAYWRVPLYATIDGTTYRVGGTDYYVASGTFQITAPNPGFEILESYYVIGTPNGWSNTYEAIGECPFEHSSTNVYDDPTFSYSFENVDEAWWIKIVPGDLYDAMADPGYDASDFWNLLIGAEYDGNSETSGSLYTSEMLDGNEPGSFMIPPGKWTFTINMETWTYTITGKAAGEEVPAWGLGGLYFRGGFGDGSWGAFPEYEFVLTDQEDTYVAPMISLPSGINFKVADSAWGTFNYGVGEGSFSFGTPYNLVYNAGDIAIPGEFNGWAEMTNVVPSASATLTMTQFNSATAGATTGIYLRGGMNGWGTDGNYEFLTTEYENVYVLASVTISAGEEFKVADEGWGPINLGTTPDVGMVVGAPFTLGDEGGNISLEASFSGDLYLVYNAKYSRYFLYLSAQ